MLRTSTGRLQYLERLLLGQIVQPLWALLRIGSASLRGQRRLLLGVVRRWRLRMRGDSRHLRVPVRLLRLHGVRRRQVLQIRRGYLHDFGGLLFQQLCRWNLPRCALIFSTGSAQPPFVRCSSSSPGLPPRRARIRLLSIDRAKLEPRMLEAVRHAHEKETL